MRTLFLCLLLLAVQEPSGFKLSRGQSVYVVALKSTSADLSLTSLDLTAGREIRKGLEKRDKFKLAPSVDRADFVLIVVSQYDQNALLKSVLAVAVAPADYAAHRSDLEALRNAALWQTERGARLRVKLKSVVEDLHKAVR